jgi:hypothetical protein
MGCSNNCNQGRSCSCMNQYDEHHTKFLRTDPYKHTEFEKEESLTSKIINTALLIIALSLVTCVLFLK